MDYLDLNKVTCRICITGNEYDGLSNLFTKKINETSCEAMNTIDDDYVLNMRLSDALQSFTCIELQQDRGLPETICCKCEFQLIETLSFIHRTNDTQQILNSYAHTHLETKVKIEDMDIHEDSSYVIEVLNDAGEVIQNEHTTKIAVPALASNNDNEQISDCDAEDAVSFLKSVKRGNLESLDTSETLKRKAIGENFSCNYCQKTFLRKSNLIDHMRLHADLRQHKCTYCNASFSHSDNLKSHLRTHLKKVDDSVLSNEKIDSYPSSTTSNSSFTQRRKKVSKQWVKVKEFLSFAEAAQEIKDEHMWSKYCTNTSMAETSVIYRCNQVKARGEQCKAGRRLVISKSTEAIALFKSQNEHTCDKINDIRLSAKAPIPENVKKIIEELFEKGLKHKQIGLELINLKLPLPSTSKLKNFLKELREKKCGQSTLSFRELFEQLTSISDLPERSDKAYVVDFNIDKHEHFHFFITSKTLLQNALFAKLMCTDTKCKLVWQGFPVHVLGTVDLNKKFHPFGISVADKEDAEDFEFTYQCLKKAIAHQFNVDFIPEILMSNGAKSISNGFETVFGSDKLILMCSAQMKKAVRCKMAELIPTSYQIEVMDDIDKLQLSSNPQIFEKASKLFLKKYEQFYDFAKYFQEQWFDLNPNWYEGAAAFRNPSSNNALESFYRIIKNEKSLRERLPLEAFIKLIISWIESWGIEYSSGENICATTTTVDQHLLTKGYAWLLANKETKKNVDGSIMVPATDHSDLSQWNNAYQWDTFNEFKNNAFIGYTTVVPEGENWINGTCTCSDFYKNYMCEHVVGIAMRLKYLQIPMEVKMAPIGSKKRGRPPKPKRALIIN